MQATFSILRPIYEKTIFYYTLRSVQKIDKFFGQKFLEYTEAYGVIIGSQMIMCVLHLKHHSCKRLDMNRALHSNANVYLDSIHNFESLVYSRNQVRSSYEFMKKYLRIVQNIYRRNPIGIYLKRRVLFDRLMINSFEHEQQLTGYVDDHIIDFHIEEILEVESVYRTIFKNNFNQVVLDGWKRNYLKGVVELLKFTREILQLRDNKLISICFVYLEKPYKISSEECLQLGDFIKKIPKCFKKLIIDDIKKSVSYFSGLTLSQIISKFEIEIKENIFDAHFNAIEQEIINKGENLNLILETRRNLKERYNKHETSLLHFYNRS